LKLLIVTLAMTSVGQGAFYNRQDIGLGRALAKRGHEVSVYNFVREQSTKPLHGRKLGENLSIYYRKSRAIGQHSLHDDRFITADADAVICFSDNQLGYGRLKKRCDHLGVICLPYVGVLGSHTADPLRKMLTDLLFTNNRYYKRGTVLAKTPQVAEALKRLGAENVVTAPVGLDGAVLHKEQADLPAGENRALRAKLKLPEEARVILYLARMVPEKRPLAMVDIFERVHKADSRCHLVAIGDGGLAGEFEKRLSEKQLTNAVTYRKQVPNSEIWQYFCAADVMVNLNTEEIFGMAILEAMYYGCPVIARRAPGPEYIIEDGTDGILCADDEAVAAAVEAPVLPDAISQNARQKIRENFLWDSTASVIIKCIENK
jgi:1,2-diacylglycerol 3-alpha-glucosyltransferase